MNRNTGDYGNFEESENLSDYLKNNDDYGQEEENDTLLHKSLDNRSPSSSKVSSISELRATHWYFEGGEDIHHQADRQANEMKSKYYQEINEFK